MKETDSRIKKIWKWFWKRYDLLHKCNHQWNTNLVNQRGQIIGTVRGNIKDTCRKCGTVYLYGFFYKKGEK